MTAVKKQRIVLYLWIALAYFLFWMMIDTHRYPGMFRAHLLNNLWRLVYVIVINYIFFEYTVPYIRKKRKYFIHNIVLFIFFFWIQMMLYSFGHFAWNGLGLTMGIYTPVKAFATSMDAVSYGVSYGFFSLLFFATLVHYHDHRKLKLTAQQFKIEKQQAELNYLKSQTNPHFLFNTLNNIYALAREKSDKAPESILRLSKILRFMLYETGDAYIALEQEVKIIVDYIALEQLRYDDSLQVNFNHDIENNRQSIPPLLLMPLVENAFKHGVSETRGQPFIKLHLSQKARELHFVVKNSSEEDQESHIRENIGLSNLRRQLELLYTDYSLKVQRTAGEFTASLYINLASHV